MPSRFDATFTRAGARSIVGLLVTPTLLLLAWTAETGADVRVCTYNLLQYTTGASASRDPNLRLILSAINPDIVAVQEVANLSAMNNIRDNVLNHASGPGSSNPYSLGSFSDTSSNLDIGLFYRTSKFSQVGYVLIPAATAPRPAHRWRLRPVTDASGNNDLYVYAMHLAATNSDQRADQAAEVRNNANSLPVGSAVIYSGDFNIGSTSEGAYQRFTESQVINIGRAWDPLNPNYAPQSWSSNSAFALIHSQSPYLDNPGAPSGAVGGGLDDRYDFVLINGPLHDGVGQDYIPGSYRSFGNDGLHYNKDINDSPVIPEGIAIANALLAASDHLPVYLDLTDPLSQPVIATTPNSTLGFPQVLTGASVSANLTIANTAPAPGIPLQYSFNQPQDYAAPVGTFELDPATNSLHTIYLTGTATSGPKFTTLSITSNSTPNPKNITLAGLVLDHAVPSTAPNDIVLTGMVDFGTQEIGQFTDQPATIHNATVPQFPNKVNLSIESGTISDDATGRFSLVNFSPPITGIVDSVAITVHFDDNNAAPGVHSATLTFTTHDSTAAAGAMQLDDIVFSLQAIVPQPQGPIRGDFNLNLVVDLEDVDPFVEVLLDPDSAAPDELWIADMNEDMVVDSADLQAFVDALLN
ncbi:MAG: hypothetical protein KF841_08325 [Phycisphaerae bacterium]|nr:hypothetical protein [Phycisphaerae bacterium]